MGFRFACLALAALTLSGCGEPTVDGSSESAMKSSIQDVRESLPAEQREAFDKALIVVGMQDVTLATFVAEARTGGRLAISSAREALDGKTGQQIINEAQWIKSERERERLAREQKRLQDRVSGLRLELAELEGKAREAERARQSLKAFEVTSASFELRDRPYSARGKPIIHISVKNGTDTAVSRVYFEGVLRSPGRSVPWVEESFNYSIPGGIEPGESASWDLEPNMFGSWWTVDAPDDAVLTVDVVRLDGPDGKTLVDGRGLSERERLRLETVKENLSDLGAVEP